MSAAVNIDVNAWPAFILRWLFAGFWGAIGWVLANHFIVPHLPGL